MKKKIYPKSAIVQSFFQHLIISLFHFLVFFVPLFFTFNTSELFEFNKMVITYAITVLIAGAWICRMLASSSLIFKRTFLDIPILIFLVSQLLSVIFSIHPYTSLLGYYSRFHGGFVSTLTYLVLYYAFVSNVEKKHLPALFLSTTISGIFVSVYAALEHFGHSISCLMVEGNFGVSCWIQDVQSRVFASFGQPNWLAAYLITLTPLTLVLTVTNSILWKKWLYGVSSVLFFLVLLYTQSRSGFLGLVVGLGMLAGAGLWKLYHEKSITAFISNKRAELLLLGATTVAVVALNGTPYTPKLSQWFSSKPAEQQQAASQAPGSVINRLDIGGTDSGEIRKIVWEGAIKVWRRYPIFGSGLETFAYSYYLDRPIAHNLVSEWDFLYNKAHNEFLNYLATAGIVGLVSYLLLLGWAGYFGLRELLKKSTPQSEALLISALLAGLAALSVSNFFGFSTVMVAVLMHLYFAFITTVTDKNTRQYFDAEPLTTTTYLSFGIVALSVLFLLRMMYQYWSADVAYSQGKSLLEAGYFEQGVEKLNTAIQKNSQEALFWDELSTNYAVYAVVYAQQEKLEEAKALMSAAEQTSNQVMQLNSRQLNYYKTRARTFITLSQLNPKYLENAKATLQEARVLAPTDAKLLYNLALIELSLQETDAGLSHLHEAIDMKPNYEAARWQLAIALEGLGETEAALEQLTYIIENITPDNTAVQDKIASLSAELKVDK